MGVFLYVHLSQCTLLLPPAMSRSFSIKHAKLTRTKNISLRISNTLRAKRCQNKWGEDERNTEDILIIISKQFNTYFFHNTSSFVLFNTRVILMFDGEAFTRMIWGNITSKSLKQIAKFLKSTQILVVINIIIIHEIKSNNCLFNLEAI